MFNPDEDGLPFIIKEVDQQYDPRHSIKRDFTFEFRYNRPYDMEIFNTMSFWLKLAAVAMREYS